MTTLCHDHTTRCESVATPFCVLRLTPWCELGAEDLSGRCSRLRVSLPPHPLGKGTDSCLTWTPFSPHSTSSSMTFASPTVPNSIGWYEGFSLLSAVEPSGVITGFCFGAASTADQPLAETFFNLRANPNPRLISVGSAYWGPYVADKGFEGAENHRRWLDHYAAQVIHPPSATPKSEAGPSLLGGGLPGYVRS